MLEFYDKNYLRKIYEFLNQILKYVKDNRIILLDYFYGHEKKEFLDSTKRYTHHVRFPIKVFRCQEEVSFQEIPTTVENSGSRTDTVISYTKKKKVS